MSRPFFHEFQPFAELDNVHCGLAGCALDAFMDLVASINLLLFVELPECIGSLSDAGESDA